MRPARRIWLLGVALAPAAFAPVAGARDGRVDDLRRPLHMPRISPGSACPVSHSDSGIDFARFGVAGGLGPGPAYPVMPRASVRLVPAASFGSRLWGGQKILWFVHPRYRGPVLVRGRRLDGPGLVRFDRGDVPATELRIAAGTRERPSFTRLRAPGCYAYQIDGTHFSRVVVFRATGAV